MNHKIFQLDWWLVAPVLFLMIISLTLLYSINPSYFQSQFMSLFISAIAFLLFSQISYKDFRSLSVSLYIFILILLVVVLIIGIESRGAVRWLAIFGRSFQASELGKPFISLALAGFLANNANRKIRTYIFPIVLLMPVVILIYLQPDLGNALLYIGVVLSVLVIYGMPLLWIVLGSLPLIIIMPLFWRFLHVYQRQRILTFLNPMEDPTGSSYNLIQAIIAVGSGMFLGKGFGEGTQSRLKFLPENHTDFIFASLAEKLGFLGSVLVLIIFAFFLYRIYRTFINCKDIFGKIFTACSFLFILFQFFVNIGMNLGLVPVVGVTLPFVSFGGSSLLANFITLGILSSISIRNTDKGILEIG